MKFTEKNKIVIKNVVGAFLVKGGALVLSLFTMPAYMRFFNNEEVLGLWFTVLSLLTWILNFDLGIGNGLRNHLTKSLTENNREESKKLISSSYISIGIICLFFLFLGSFIFIFINWNKMFNIDETIIESKYMLISIEITYAGIIVQMFLRIISSILYALQKSFINNFLTLCTTIIVLICVLAIIPNNNQNFNMVLMSIIHSLAVIIPLLITTIIVFLNKKFKYAFPSVKFYSKDHSKKVLSLGGVFFIVQVLFMIMMNTNEFLITTLTSSSKTVDYQIYQKIFTLGSTLFTLMLTPIWSAITKAKAEKDISWIKRTYKNLLLISILGTLFEFLIIPFLQFGVNIWLKDEAIQVNFSYGFVFAIMGSLMIFNGTFSSISNGIGELKTQLVCFSVGSLLKILLSIFFVKILNSWIGVIIANSIALGIYCIIQPITLNKKFRCL